MGSILSAALSAFFGAMFQSLGNYLNGIRHDQQLKALGYDRAQRDIAVSEIRAIDGASAARARVALDQLINPGRVRVADKYARRPRI